MGSNQKESWKEKYATYQILQDKIQQLRKKKEIIEVRLASYLKQREEMKGGAREHTRRYRARKRREAAQQAKR